MASLPVFGLPKRLALAIVVIFWILVLAGGTDEGGSHGRFPAPWKIEQIQCGYKVLDASGRALAYVYACETKAEADIAKVLTFDEARRIAVNVLGTILKAEEASP